jgi:bifunctional DNase/RNase
MIEMQVREIQANSGTYHRVVLQEKEGASYLHIMIGPSEAGAISAAHNGQKPVRPLSYDLACALLNEINARIDRVEITALRDGIYYAEIHLQGADGTSSAIDSRPSDAIALALRTDAPIFASEDVLEDGAEKALELSGSPEPAPGKPALKKPGFREFPGAGMKGISGRPANDEDTPSPLDLLKRRLEQAVSEEAYEEAARLRDRITELQRQP